MIICIIGSMISALIYAVVTFHPLENSDLNRIVCMTALVLYILFMQIAYGCHERLKSRIKALEDKLNDKEGFKC